VVKLFSFPSPRHISLRFPVNNSNYASASITWFDLTKKFYTLREKDLSRFPATRPRELRDERALHDTYGGVDKQ